MIEDLFSDIINNKKILKKIRNKPEYAQHLYAGLCNNVFRKSIGSGIDWHKSWRFIASTMATLRSEGDYMDFYCSGISENNPKHLQEGIISEEIANDIQSLGWNISNE